MDGIIQTTSASQAPRKDLAVNPLAEGTDADRVADVSRGVVGESVVGELGDTGLGRVGASMNFRSPRWRSIFARMRREDLCELNSEVGKMLVDGVNEKGERIQRWYPTADQAELVRRAEEIAAVPSKPGAVKRVTIWPYVHKGAPVWRVSTDDTDDITECGSLQDATTLAEHLLTPPIVMRAKAKRR